MKPQSKSVGQPKHAFDIGFQQRVGKKLDALLNGQIIDELGNVIGTILYADGNTIFKFKASSGGAGSVKGEWDPTVAYNTGDIVFFTPDGDFARTFYALQAVSGLSPDTGSPNWASFPSSTPGVWG